MTTLARTHSHWLALALAVVAVAPPARGETIDGIAAVVNGEIITLSEVEEHAGPGLPARDATGSPKLHREAMLRHALEDLVIDKLVSKECKEQSLEPTTAEIDNAIEDVVRANHIDPAGLERALKDQGLTMPHYREMLSQQLCRMKVVEMKVKNRVSVTEDDVKSALANQGRTTHPAEELKIRDIFVPINSDAEIARAGIRTAHDRLARGMAFEAVARETGGPLAANGGDLGWVKISDLAPELQKAAASLADGAVSGIIETPRGFHILKVEAHRSSSDAASVAEAREALRQQLQSEKLQKATEDYLAELRRNAEIEIRLP